MIQSKLSSTQSVQSLLQLINGETTRQQETISLIASENLCPQVVRQVMSSELCNKYAEGRPGRRWYEGCNLVDQIEIEAQERLKSLFKVNYANVQPHSGADANTAVFLALLKPYDSILGLALSDGGHLSHGSPHNLSGMWLKPESYHLDAQGLIDMNQVRQKALQCKPKLIIAGSSAYSRVIDWNAFRAIADEVGAYFLADMAHYSGLIAAEEYPSPAGYADVITSTTHKTLRGPRGGVIMCDDEALYKKINMGVFPGLQGGPSMHSIAAKAVSFTLAAQPEFKVYIQQVIKNARAMVEVFQKNSIKVISGGTDTHMFNLDLDRSGRDFARYLAEQGIVVNKEMLPNDPRSVFETSGIRIGTASMTSRGMKEHEAVTLAQCLVDALSGVSCVDVIRSMCKQFPICSSLVD